jgi:hypothetical protein
MKKSIFLILLVISSLICSAQLQVKEGSFKKVEGFVNINTEKMFDDNDRPYAVLKIKTENINDKQRRELSFGGDAQTFFETEYKDGEVWLYISYYATFLKISHPDLSSTEFWFPYDMEPKRGYELTLVNKPALDEEVLKRIEKLEKASTETTTNTDKFGYIVIKTGSLEGATVYIDGKEMEMKTPFVSDPIKKGPHKIMVVKEGYEPYTDIVVVDDKGIKTMMVDLEKGKTTNPYRHKGMVFIPEINVSPSWNYNTGIEIIPQLSLEYMFTNKVGFGIDAGFLYTSKGIGSIPLCGQMSYYFINRKASPFINLKVGYALDIFDYNDNSYYWHSIHGLYSSFTAGININRSRIGVSVELYNHHKYNYAKSYSNNTRHILVGISYSYLIPFRKNK